MDELVPRVGELPPLPIPPISVPGLSTCLEESRLICDGHAASSTVDAVDALRIAEHALARRRSVVLFPPDPAAPLAALVAAAVHVADAADAYRAGIVRGSRRRVAVVTGDYRLRGLYRGIAIRDVSGGAAPIRRVFPAAALGAGGVVNILDSTAHDWSTVFIRAIADLPRVAPVDLAVLDLPCPDAIRAGGLDIPVVAVARDPADFAAIALAERWPAFGWERSDGAARLEIAAIPAPHVCENAGLFWTDIGALARAGSSPLGAELAREAFALFYDLLGAALPLHVLDQYASTPIEARLTALRRAARLFGGEVGELYVPMVEAELSGLAAAVAAGVSKADALPRLLADLVDDRRDALLLARTATLARAYRDHLNAIGLGAVRVSTLTGAAAERPADVAVLTGMAPTWARWIYRSRAGASVRVLAYSGGETFDEAAIVARSAQNQSDVSLALASPSRRIRSWALLAGEPVWGASQEMMTRGLRRAAVIAVEAPPPPEAPPGLWQGNSWVVDAEPLAWSRTERERAVDQVVDGLRVGFDDGSWAVLASEDIVGRWRPASQRLDHVVASTLQAGDRLVFLDEDAHKTLLGKVLEVADGVPALAAAGAWLDLWRQALRRGYRQAGGYAQFSRAVNAERTREGRRALDAVTVRFWVTGNTIGPEDPADVRRVAAVVGDPILLAAHSQVHLAMRTLRNAHVQLGRRLADLARRFGPAAASGALPLDELLDERSGLTAADIETAVTLATVTTVDPVGDVPALLTGRRVLEEAR